MANRSIAMFEYKQVIHRMRSGESDRTISKSGLIGRTKTKFIRFIAKLNGWLNLDVPLPNEEDIANNILQHNKNNIKRNSSIEPFMQEIKDLSERNISAKVIHQFLIEKYNYQNSYHSVLRCVNKINENSKLLKEITVPLFFKPGEAVQIDFGQGPKIFDENTGKEVGSWIFVMTLCYSRHQYAEIIRHQDSATWLGCHRRGFEFFGGIPRKTIIDNAKCGIVKASYYDPIVQRSYGQLAEDYGFIISACPPYQPEKKGIVENGVKYIKSNFLPLKKFKNFHNANVQLIDWILDVAGNRIHGTTRKKPLDLFNEVEKNVLQPLPAVAPEFCIWHKAKCYRDCCVRFEYCRYSVPYQFVKQELWIKATETMVKIYHDYKLVAIHVRCYTKGETITLTEHFPPQAKEYLLHDNNWCIENAKNIGPFCLQVVEELLNNKQCDYLRAAQGIIKLKKKFGEVKVELASQKVLEIGAVSYNALKEILKKGLEGLPIDKSVNNQLDKAYLGEGKFCRKFEDFLIN